MKETTDRLERIIGDINGNLPSHGRGLIYPDQMRFRRAANCFGRVATIGSELAEEGAVPVESMRLLISKAHGTKFGQGDYWFGHSALVLDDGRVQDFVDVVCGRNAFPRGPDFLRQLAIDDTTEEVALDGLYEGYPAPGAVAGVVDTFRVLPFAEGLERYQAGHPSYADKPRLTMRDYARFYGSLTVADLTAAEAGSQRLAA